MRRTTAAVFALTLIYGSTAPAQDRWNRGGPPTASPAATAQRDNLRRPLATRQTSFSIPFSIPTPGSGDEQPVEVQLFLSTNRGESWRPIDRQRPDSRRFLFRAPRDGEYWFATRTIDRAGRARPDGAVQPELKVLVDTQPPQLNLTATAGRDGRVTAAWQFADPDIAPKSFTLHYKLDAGSPWKSVALHGSQLDQSGRNYEGQVAWTPDANQSQVIVRAEVRDRAGNASVVNRTVFLPTRNESVADGGFDRRAGSGPVAAAGNAGQRWPSEDQRRRQAQSRAAQWPERDSSGAGRFANSNDAPRSDDRVAPAAVTPIAPASGPVRRGPVIAESTQNPPEQSGEVSSSRPVATGWDVKLPPGEEPQMTNRSEFVLHYEVESVGPTGVGRVELWGTTDGGRSWRQWNTDGDRQSPVEVAVNDDGIYGFRVVVENKNGFGEAPPKPGEPAEIWVGVDRVKPQARLIAAEYGSGHDEGHLRIQWQARDEKLAARPVTLLASDGSQGPWRTIAAGLPNDGVYRWKIDEQAPRRVYLRIEVRDAAGNVGLHELAQPVSTEPLRPQGRIRGLVPSDDEPPAGRRAASRFE